MRNLAIQYYHEGYDCAQCILLAAGKKYNLYVPEELVNAVFGVGSGFGIGGFCGAIVAGTLILGMVYPENQVKQLRLELLNKFYDRRGSFDCGRLTSGHGPRGCSGVIGEVSGIIDEIIQREGIPGSYRY